MERKYRRFLEGFKGLISEEAKMDKELEEWYKLHRFYMGDYQTKDLANYLRISPRTVQRWIKEKAKPNATQLSQIKKYLESKQP